MVFRGRPSKACQRCRDRRLKCDLKYGSCTPCLRASAHCTGYRNPEQLRIRNESDTVRSKSLGLPYEISTSIVNAMVPSPHQQEPRLIRSLSLPIEQHARVAFFAYYVTTTSKAWEFLKPFSENITQMSSSFKSADTRIEDVEATSNHLATLSIDAVGLAFLSHQLCSFSISIVARKRYTAALRRMGEALTSEEVAANQNTFVASLLLDLFEKIVFVNRKRNDEDDDGSSHRNSNSDNKPVSWISHVHGAMALIRLRGLHHFQDHPSLRMLVRFTINCIISCAASQTAVPEEVNLVRVHVERYLDIKDDPKWRLSGLLIHYANLSSGIKNDQFNSTEECLLACLNMDERLRELAMDIPASWMPLTVFSVPCADDDDQEERTYIGRIDLYPDRHITQGSNVFRHMRILLNESIIKYCDDLGASGDDLPLSEIIAGAYANIQTLASEIAASVPQYVYIDCYSNEIRNHWRRQEQHTPDYSRENMITTTTGIPKFNRNNCHHQHSPSQILHCYTLIFPLYVAGRSIGVLNILKEWIVKQLHYMHEHFGIHNAGVVAGLLEEENNKKNGATGNNGKDKNNAHVHEDPWTVYAMLGSYGFAA